MNNTYNFNKIIALIITLSSSFIISAHYGSQGSSSSSRNTNGIRGEQQNRSYQSRNPYNQSEEGYNKQNFNQNYKGADSDAYNRNVEASQSRYGYMQNNNLAPYNATNPSAYQAY